MKIYIEGAGPSDAQRTECQKAFKGFFEAAGLTAQRPTLVACGSRNEAYNKFKIAIRNGDSALLLVDSEDIIATNPHTGKPSNPWDHLKKRDNWECPQGATDNNVHFMAVCMESWFIADRDQLIAYFSKGNRRCNPNALPVHKDIEKLSKSAIFEALRKATTENPYTKGSRSFELLETMRPDKIAAASYHARRLFYHLKVSQPWLDYSEFDLTSL